MCFWLAILGGFLFAGLAIKIGFFETFAAFFNVLIAVYAMLFLTPTLLRIVPQAAGIPQGVVITSLAVGIGVFLLLYAVCFFLITGQFSVPFPKVFDVVCAGGLGFLWGFLLFSVMLVLLSAATIPFLSNMTTEQGLAPNTNYICWWCDRVHRFVGSRDLHTEQPTQDAISYFLDKAHQQQKSTEFKSEDTNSPPTSGSPQNDPNT